MLWVSFAVNKAPLRASNPPGVGVSAATLIGLITSQPWRQIWILRRVQGRIDSAQTKYGFQVSSEAVEAATEVFCDDTGHAEVFGL